MGVIKVMDEVLANKIAAGEVVERICNAVKELVENSIDAGSKNIKIELNNAGIKKISHVDQNTFSILGLFYVYKTTVYGD